MNSHNSNVMAPGQPIPMDQAPSFWMAHEEEVKRFIASRMGGASHAVIEDVVQEVFIAAANCERNGQIPEKPLGWLRAVAQNKIRDHWRKESKYGPPGTVLDEAQSTEPSPYEWVLSIERQDQVAFALEQLPKEERRLLEMKYLHGTSYESIAQEMGLSLKSVEYRLAKARQSLRDALTRSPGGLQ